MDRPHDYLQLISAFRFSNFLQSLARRLSVMHSQDIDTVGTKEVEDVEHTPARFLIIGAGSRGNAYAKSVFDTKTGVIASVADPIASSRQRLGRKYIWQDGKRQEDQEFDTWQDFFEYETIRRKRQAAGERVLPGFDGVFICTLDHTHVDVITTLAPLKLHVMSEKPLATNLQDCIRIYKALESPEPTTIFSVGHVLRYSPHNMLLRKLLLEDQAIGDILSMEHAEPVGWWHFSHSYVRGNWRKESATAPSLLTKSCHDIDFMLWILASQSRQPSRVSSFGSLAFFRKTRKPKEALDATNCLSCSHEPDCLYSAKKIYLERQLLNGNYGWPVKIVEPEIEDLWTAGKKADAQDKLLERLRENYDENASQKQIDERPWFGRCVWESDNDVCDNQTVTFEWEGEMTASFHMVAFTEKQCERRGRVYGTKGEIEYDSKTIRVFTFEDGRAEVYHPHQAGGGHGGGDAGLAGAFVKAVDDVIRQRQPAKEAQMLRVGCSLEDVIRSHAMVFAAEEARRNKTVVDWEEWWKANVLAHMEGNT